MDSLKSRRSWKIVIALLLAGGLAWSGVLERALEFLTVIVCIAGSTVPFQNNPL